MKRLLLLLALLIVPVKAFSLGSAYGFCEQGNKRVQVQGMNSTTLVQQSYPQCTITVYNAGTVTLATIFSDNAATPTSLANPFTANTNGTWEFFAANGVYDIVKSAGTPTPGISPAITTFAVSVVDPATLPVTTSVCSNFPGADVGAKLQACHNALPNTGGLMDATAITGLQAWSTLLSINKPNVRLLLGSATFTLSASGGIAINNSRSGVIGAGQHATVFQYGKFAPGSVITLSCGSLTCAQNYIEGLGFDALGDTAGTKIAIDAVDQEENEYSDISVSNWTGMTSVGIRTRGRQALFLHRITDFADIPIEFSKNPNLAGGPFAGNSVDHYHLQDLYLAGNGNPNILIDDGSNVSALTIDGYEAWVGGTYGLQYLSTTDTLSAQLINIQNVRWEQGTGTTGYTIQLSNASNFFGVNIKNVYTGGPRGLALKNISGGTVESFVFANPAPAGKEALNVQGAVSMAFVGNFFNLTGGSLLDIANNLATSIWLNNDLSPTLDLSGTAGAAIAGSSLLIPNNSSLSALNQAGLAAIPIVKVDASNILEFAPNSTTSDFGGNLHAGGAGVPVLCGTMTMCVPNGKNYGSLINAGNDGFALIAGDSSDRVVLSPQNHAITTGANTAITAGLTVGAPSGGNQGLGTINAQGTYYSNGTPGATATLSCGGGLAVKTLTIVGGLVTGATCGAP